MKLKALFVALLVGFATMGFSQSEGAPDNPMKDVQVEVVDTKITGVKPIMKPDTTVNFETARLADMDGNKTTIDLKEKVTLIEYWSRSANKNNLYWNRVRELEHRFKDNPNVQIISINYDFALGGKHQREKLKEYLKSHTVPEKMLVDLDDGVREIFNLTGTTAYMVFNHFEQYLYTGRGDAPETEEMFKVFDEALLKKAKWDAYVKKTMDEANGVK